MLSGQNGKDIAMVVISAAVEGRISCARAFVLSGETGFTPEQLGEAMDQNNIRISGCQLGLFGHGNNKAVKPAEKVDEGVADLLRANLVDGRIPCEAVWRIADELNMKRFDMACACEKMGIRICRCRLGAFK